MGPFLLAYEIKMKMKDIFDSGPVLLLLSMPVPKHSDIPMISIRMEGVLKVEEGVLKHVYDSMTKNSPSRGPFFFHFYFFIFISLFICFLIFGTFSFYYFVIYISPIVLVCASIRRPQNRLPNYSLYLIFFKAVIPFD